MSKKLFIFLSTLSFLYSSTAIIKNGDVKAKINGIEKNLKVDQKINLKIGESICYINGSGKIIIDNTQLYSKNIDCFKVTSKEDESNFIVDVIKSFFTKGEDDVSAGSRSIINNQVSIIYSKSDDNIIYFDEYKPYPIEIIHKDSNNKEIKVYKFNKSISQFKLPVDKLKDSDILELKNGFAIENIPNLYSIDEKIKVKFIKEYVDKGYSEEEIKKDLLKVKEDGYGLMLVK